MSGADEATTLERAAIKRHAGEHARKVAREIIGERHSRVQTEYYQDGEQRIVVWCNSADHDGAAASSGVRWPCDAVRLARAVLDDPTAGGPDEPQGSQHSGEGRLSSVGRVAGGGWLLGDARMRPQP